MHHDVEEAGLDPESHLAREWSLFQAVETGSADGLFYCWHTDRPVVVVGRNSRVTDDVVEEACNADQVRVLRRFSGGGAVVLGPGCLNYAAALSLVSRPRMIGVAASFRVVLDAVVASLGVPGLAVEGRSDLVLNGRKVSGNAQRRGRRALIHHGTLLYAFDSELAARYLREPARQPEYRAGRSHTAFIGNLPFTAETLRARLGRAWPRLQEPFSASPLSGARRKA
jgi:lipoate---protein ligase